MSELGWVIVYHQRSSAFGRKAIGDGVDLELHLRMIADAREHLFLKPPRPSTWSEHSAWCPMQVSIGSSVQSLSGEWMLWHVWNEGHAISAAEGLNLVFAGMKPPWPYSKYAEMVAVIDHGILD